MKKVHGTVCAIDDISLSIHRGETVGLLGANGSGKSSLLRLILNLDRPDAGKVLFNGVDFAAAVRSGFEARFVTGDTIGPLGRSASRHLSTLSRPIASNQIHEFTGFSVLLGVGRFCRCRRFCGTSDTRNRRIQSPTALSLIMKSHLSTWGYY